MVRQRLKEKIKESISRLWSRGILPEFDLPDIKIECPGDESNGDYSTNIAMQLAGILKKPSLEIADLIVSGIEHKDSKLFERIWAIRPGFINFFLSQDFLQKQMGEILKKDFGELRTGKRKRVNIEFISANPTGPLHIGNGRGAFYGDILGNVLEKAGYEVEKEYFVNDAKKSNQIKELGKTALGKGETYLNENLKLKIKKLKEKLRKNTSEGEAGNLLGREIQKENKRFIEKKLKIKFDKWFSEEQELFKTKKVERVFQWLKGRGLTYEKEGAVWLKTSEFGDEKDWVIIRSDNEPSYFLSDIAYHKEKFDRGYDKIIDVWGADHQGHVRKMVAAAKILERKAGFEILISQLVRLKTGKMSKRTGDIIALEDLINEVGLDAARFFYSTKSLGAQMEFDLDLAKEQSEKNPVYYIQYAHARICSILKKSEEKFVAQDYELLNHPAELSLIKKLVKFPEIIEEVARDYQIQRIPQYAMDLASAFHRFYGDCKVLSENESLKKARIGLVFATKNVLKSVLDLIGVFAPEKM